MLARGGVAVRREEAPRRRLRRRGLREGLNGRRGQPPEGVGVAVVLVVVSVVVGVACYPSVYCCYCCYCC